MAMLRKQGIEVFNYIDDLFIISITSEGCVRAVNMVFKVLTNWDFFVNYEKSSLILNTSMRFLGFVLDSVEMIVKPPEDKVEKTLDLLRKFLQPNMFSIREVASLVGVMNDFVMA